MQCREAVFAEDVLIYVVDNYRGEEYIRAVSYTHLTLPTICSV